MLGAPTTLGASKIWREEFVLLLLWFALVVVADSSSSAFRPSNDSSLTIETLASCAVTGCFARCCCCCHILLFPRFAIAKISQTKASFTFASSRLSCLALLARDTPARRLSLICVLVSRPVADIQAGGVVRSSGRDDVCIRHSRCGKGG